MSGVEGPQQQPQQRPKVRREPAVDLSRHRLARANSSRETNDSGIGKDEEAEATVREFLLACLAKSPKDRALVLGIERDLRSFCASPRRVLAFPQMTSYQRMLVHKAAALFALKHALDRSGLAVVVSKEGPPAFVPPLQPEPPPALLWAVSDIHTVPQGSLLIDPRNGNYLRNNDGSLYRFDPSNPPVLGISPPPPPSAAAIATPMVHHHHHQQHLYVPSSPLLQQQQQQSLNVVQQQQQQVLYTLVPSQPLHHVNIQHPPPQILIPLDNQQQQQQHTLRFY